MKMKKATPKVLVIEDKQSDFLLVKDLLKLIVERDNAFHDIEAFLIEDKPATNVASALRLLEKAHREGEPYDIVILDLELDDKMPEGTSAMWTEGQDARLNELEAKFPGLKLISIIRELGVAKEIIVFTSHPKYELVLRALRDGAIDFVEKYRSNEQLPASVLSCWQRILVKDSNRLFENRIKDLIPYTEKGLARRFSAYFTDFAQLVTITSEDIINYVKERFGLDPQNDPEDFLVQLLKKQEDKSQAMLQRLEADLSSREVRDKPESLNTLLGVIQKELLPCLLIKRANLDWQIPNPNDLLIRTFHNDARAILREIILGTLITQSNFGDERLDLQITAQLIGDQVEICIQDNLPLILPEDAEKINAGFNYQFNYSTSPQELFSRTWGLSVVQQIAILSGGRLNVKAQSPGNLITYFAPSFH
jgi:CheY-like chemotaxis protein